jgi:hypothetical protein
VRQAASVPTAPEIRALTADDADVATELDNEAFGSPSGSAPRPYPPAGTHPWGVFLDGRLVAAAEAHGHR